MKKGLPVGIVLSLFLAALAAIGVSTLFRMGGPGGQDSAISRIDLKGASSASFQAVFDSSLVFRNAAIDAWGRFRWDLFRQGYTGVIAGADGWLFSTEEFTADLGYVKGELRVLLKDAKNTLASKGILLVVLPVPPKALIQRDELGPHAAPAWLETRHKAFLGLLDELAIPAVDLGAAWSGTDAFMRTDTHWSPEGARMAAQALAERIRALKAEGNPGVQGIPVTSFDIDEPSLNGERNLPGDLLSFLPVSGGWFRDLPPGETVRVDTISERLDFASGESAAASLFAVQEIPFALVGTSYSASPLWGFVNSLKIELSADVLELAQEGKGPFKPMEETLASDHLFANGVRVVIWEIPERYIPPSAIR